MSMAWWRKMFLVGLVCTLIVFLTNCAVTIDTSAGNPDAGGLNIDMVATNEEIAVYKIVDGMATCYISMIPPKRMHVYTDPHISCVVFSIDR